MKINFHLPFNLISNYLQLSFAHLKSKTLPILYTC